MPRIKVKPPNFPMEVIRTIGTPVDSAPSTTHYVIRVDSIDAITYTSGTADIYLASGQKVELLTTPQIAAAMMMMFLGSLSTAARLEATDWLMEYWNSLAKEERDA